MRSKFCGLRRIGIGALISSSRLSFIEASFMSIYNGEGVPAKRRRGY